MTYADHVCTVCRGCGADKFIENVRAEGRQAGRLLTDEPGALIWEGDGFIELDAASAEHVDFQCTACGKRERELRDLVRLIHDHAT